MIESIISAVFPVAFVVVLLEAVLAFRWTPFYFRHGLRVFRMTVSVPRVSSHLPDAQTLSTVNRRAFVLPIRVHRLDRTSFAVRERWTTPIQFGYTPVMHELLEFDLSHHWVRITGLANWFTPLFLVVAITLPLSNDRYLLFGGGGLLLLSSIYLLQRHRYRSLAVAAAGLWTESKVP